MLEENHRVTAVKQGHDGYEKNDAEDGK